MANLRLYYKSDYKIRETFKTQAGETIDPREYNFSFTFIAGKENTYTCSHVIGGGKNEWVNCVYDSVNNAVLCMLDNHNLLPGRLKRELTIEEPDSDFPDNKLDYITFKAYEIELIDTTDGDTLYNIIDEEVIISGTTVTLAQLATIIHDSTEKETINDNDEVPYLDSETEYGIVKTTWLNIKAKLKTYFDTLFEPKNSNIQSHISDTGIHVTSGEKSNFHSHSNKSDLDNVSGSNTGDETAQTIKNKLGITTLSGSNTGDQSASNFDIKDLTDSTNLRSTWNAKQDALSADVDYLTPTTASATYEPKKGENDNYVTDDEKTVIENTSGENTGDETAESIIDKIGTDGQIKSDYLMNILEPVQVTYEELYELKQSNNLTPGQVYEITDYVTTYKQPISGSSLSGEVEPLLIKAITNNSLHIKAKSTIYPLHEIWYNIENIQEIAYGSTKGFIYRRRDEKNNDIGFDFMNVKFRRWQVTGNAWEVGIIYAKKSVVKRGNYLYISTIDNNVGIDPAVNNTTIADLDSYYWIRCNFPDLSYVSCTANGNISPGRLNLTFAVTGLYEDYLMFSTPEIYAMSKNNFINNDWHQNSIGYNMFKMNNTVFMNNVLTNVYGSYSGVNNNVLQGDIQCNTILSGFQQNHLSTTFYYLIISDNFDNNIIQSHFRHSFLNGGASHIESLCWEVGSCIFGGRITSSNFTNNCYYDNIFAKDIDCVSFLKDGRNSQFLNKISYCDIHRIDYDIFERELENVTIKTFNQYNTIKAKLIDVTFEDNISYLKTGTNNIKDVIFGRNIANADLTTLIYPTTPCRIEIVEGTPDKLCIKYLNADGRQCYSIVGLDGTILEAENVYETETNKESDVETYKESITKYPTLKGLYDWAVGKFVQLSQIVTSWEATPTHDNIPSEKLVKDSLNLKADIDPANGSTSALRALFIARGYDSYSNTYHCVYNENTGYYEMNGLTDITEDEMSVIYNYSTSLHNINLRAALSFVKCRTFYPLKHMINSSYDINVVCQNNNVLESFFALLYANVPVDISNMPFAFFGCVNLKIVNGLRVSVMTTATNAVNAFFNCQKLEECCLHGVKVSFSFGWSPLLSLASLQYLVTNRANGTTRITITVHSTTWSRLNDSVNYPTWNALLVDAVANQYIDFASA